MSEFKFSAENESEVGRILSHYPDRRAALLPLLHLVQEQEGFVSTEAEKTVADILEIPVVDIREVLTFYSLFFTEPMGKHHIRVCNSLSCWLRGSLNLSSRIEEKLGVKSGGITSDRKLSWEVVADCMGACEIAPMLQLDKDYHGELTPDGVSQLLEKIDREAG